MTDQPDPNAPRSATPEQPSAGMAPTPDLSGSPVQPAPPVQPPSPVPPEWNPMPAGYPGATDPATAMDPAAGSVPPAGWTPPAPPPAKPASKLRVLIPLIVIAGFIGVVLYMTRDNQLADSLEVGQCIDLPTSAEFSTVTKRECTVAHDAEIVLNVEYTESNDSYPISLTFDRFSEDTCNPAVAAYVGDAAVDTGEISYGWFYPTSDSWASGDRTVTCYAYRLDEAKLTQSVKAAS
ncbi:MAG TPA: septum formation family protein [Candidatus Limnocylindria bacterium]|nr:septum formation family protein [Candidatus Limnocylindria bacterium]